MEKNFSDSYHIEFVLNDIEAFPFPEESFRKWILAIIANEEKEPGAINYIFCSDDTLLDINQQYLDHDTFTDIITFDYSSEFDNISGDIYISVDMVRYNAKKFREEFLRELARVIVHGVLHIIGYKDKSEKDTLRMREKENYYLDLAEFL